MCNDRQPADTVNQLKRISRGNLFFWHPARAVILQKTFECLVEAVAYFALNQRARYMRSSWRAAIGESENIRFLERHLHFLEAGNDLTNPLLTPFLKTA